MGVIFCFKKSHIRKSLLAKCVLYRHDLHCITKSKYNEMMGVSDYQYFSKLVFKDDNIRSAQTFLELVAKKTDVMSDC